MNGWLRCSGLLLAALATHAAHAQPSDPHTTECSAVHGTLVPVCNGAICNQGNVTGDLKGRFSSRVTSIYPAGSGWLYSGWTRIELEGRTGTIETLNEGFMPFDANKGYDNANATEVLNVSAAGGKFQDHSGSIVLTGAHALGRPAPYAGRICHRISPS